MAVDRRDAGAAPGGVAEGASGPQPTVAPTAAYVDPWVAVERDAWVQFAASALRGISASRTKATHGEIVELAEERAEAMLERFNLRWKGR